MPARRPLFKALVTVAFIVALSMPVAVALATGFIEVTFTAWGERPGPDPTPIEAWVALALAYLVWTPLVLVGLVYVLDRLGYRYTPPERERRPSRRERRRRDAGMRYLQGRAASSAGTREAPPTGSREAPPRGALEARPTRGASRPPSPRPPSSRPSSPRPSSSRPPHASRDGD